MNQSDFIDALVEQKEIEATASVADALDELADLMKLNGAKGIEVHKIRKYKEAATSIRNCDSDLSKMSKSQLMSLSSVGNSIADKVLEFIQTGKISKLEKLKKDSPPASIAEFTKLRKIGPAGAKKLWKEYNVTTMNELIKLADDGKITDQTLLDSIQFYKTTSERILLSEALEIGEPIMESLKMFTAVKEIMYGGSILRGRDTVHDIDFIALVEDINSVNKVFDDFVKFADEVIVKGDTKTAIYVKGVKVELSIIKDNLEWGASKFHYTGPANYNKKNRSLAIQKGFMLNDKGLWDSNGNRLDDGTEESICDKLGIKWIPPELRDLACITNDILDDIITEVKHDYHIHTKLSDGTDTVEEIIRKAIAYGLELIAITDHGAGLPMAEIKNVDRYISTVRSIQSDKIKVKVGIEANMTKDGSLYYTEDELKRFDVVVASAHSHFDLSKEEQTARYINAIEILGRRGGINIIGHPTLEDHGKRNASEFDWDTILKACAEHNVAIEINSLPTRIGLSIELMQRAKRIGVHFSIGSDSHGYNEYVLDLGLLRARRAGLTKEDLI